MGLIQRSRGWGLRMATLETVSLDISVVLGRNRMPIHQLLRMGRGAVIELDSSEDDEVEILANDQPIARGKVVVNGNKIAVEVSELLCRPKSMTEAGLYLAEQRTLIANLQQDGAAEAA
jgi:flagellar motor switch protein FliN